MDAAADLLRKHKNLTQTTAGTIASIGLENIGKKTAGVLVTPAVWVLNYTVEGAKPSVVDFGIWGTGFFSAGSSIVVGVVKSVVDDDMGRKLSDIRRLEGPRFGPFIKNCYDFGYSAAAINALKVASVGGTAWQAPNGLWVYITDANDHHVADFKPQSYKIIYQPKLPLEKTEKGFIWSVTR